MGYRGQRCGGGPLHSASEEPPEVSIRGVTSWAWVLGSKRGEGLERAVMEVASPPPPPQDATCVWRGRVQTVAVGRRDVLSMRGVNI